MASKGDVEEVVVSMSKASIEVKEEEKGKKIDRHCGFCLTLVPGAEVKFCGKCKRRAYCSKECQTADWIKPKDDGPSLIGKVHGYGQGHKDWCGLEVGEEDLDWKVAPISGKGLGLVALRDIPPLYRILIEGMQPMPVGGTRHPEMDNLAPENASLYKKFDINCLYTDSGSKIGLRLSRANHSCESNASYTDEEEFNVFILYSNREIKAGEEICFAYARFNDLCKIFHQGWTGRSPNEIRNTLTSKWGIVCPSHCPCRDLENLKMMKLCKELDSEGQKCFTNNKKALRNLEKIIEMAKKLGCSQSILCLLYWWGCEYAVVKRDTLPKAREYLEKCLAFRSAVYHPKNKGMVKMTQGLIEDLSKARGYLSAEF